MAASRNRTSPDARLNDAVAATLAAAGVTRGARLCVALSGGVDSMTLLQVLAAQRGAFGFALSAAHVHHGLSPNADAWAELCAETCRAHEIPFQLHRVTVRRDHRGGLEAAARDARREALARQDCDWLVLGHHADDQAETLLFRLVRGAGVRGAGAMAKIEPGVPGRLRPFLDLRRAEIVSYAQDAGLAWGEDESNADPRFSRNYLRHEVLPRIEAAFPGGITVMARAAAHFRESVDLLDALAAIDAERCGGATWVREGLLALDDARVRNMLRWRLRALGLAAPDSARLDEAVRQLREAREPKPLRLELGASVCCAYRGCVWLEPGDAAAIVPCAWQGEVSLPWGDGAVRFERVTGAGLALDALEACERVMLVTRWSGLQLRPVTARPSRNFKALCQAAGVPPWLRDRMPVLRAGDEALWIGGLDDAGFSAAWRCPPGAAGVLPVWEL